MSGKDAPMYYDPERKAIDVYPGYPHDQPDNPAPTRAAEQCALADCGYPAGDPLGVPMSLCAALELARLERERDEERRAVRDIERMAASGLHVAASDDRGSEWAVFDAGVHIVSDWHPTLALCVAAWAKANPEQEGK